MNTTSFARYASIPVIACVCTFFGCGTGDSQSAINQNINGKSQSLSLNAEDVAVTFKKQAQNAADWRQDTSFGDSNLRVFTYTTSTQKRWLAVARLNSVIFEPRLSGTARLAPTSQTGKNCRVAINAGYFSGQSKKPSSIYVEKENQLGFDEQRIQRPKGVASPTRAVFGENTSGWEFRWARTLDKQIYSYPSPADPWKTPEPGTSWNPINAVGAGPMLVKDSRSTVTASGELFDAQSGVDPQGNQPRTAVALGANGLLYLLVVDGRRTDAQGINLQNLSNLFVDIGASSAMNLDGGGSSTFVTNSVVRNKPSDGSERAVSSVFCIQ